MKDTNEKNQILVQGSILAVASLVVRLIGLLYRVPMTRIIGDTGIGYYSAAFQVYNVILLLSSYSMPQALSRLMATRLGKRQYRNAFRYFLCSLAVSVVSGLIFSAIMYYGADFIAGTLLHAELAAYALRVLAPTVFVMSFLGVFRGYFQGFQNMMPTAVSQIIEQIVNAVVSIVGAAVLFKQGYRVFLVKGGGDYAGALGAKGGTLGTLWGAVAALAFMLFMYVLSNDSLKRRMRREPANRVAPYPRVFKEIYWLIIPIVMSTFIFHMLNLVDNGIFDMYMKRQGVDEATYMAIWGVYSGKYQLLINLPIALATAMASSIIPGISKAVELRNKGEIHQKIDISLRFTTLITIPAMIGMMVLGNDLLHLLFGYKESIVDGFQLILLGGFAVLFYAYATISNGILHGLGKMYTTVKNALIGLVAHVVILFILLWVFKAGIFGVVISYVVFGAIVSVLNFLSIYHATGYFGNMMKTYLLPLGAAIIMAILVYGINFATQKAILAIINKPTIAALIGVAFSVFVGILVYFVAAISLHAVDESDLYEMPMGGRLVRLATKFHVL